MNRIYLSFENSSLETHLVSALPTSIETQHFYDERNLLTQIRTECLPDAMVVDSLDLALKVRDLIDRPVFVISLELNHIEQRAAWKEQIFYLPTSENPRELIVAKLSSITKLQDSINKLNAAVMDSGADLYRASSDFDRYYQPKVLVVEDDIRVVDRIKYVMNTTEELRHIEVLHRADVESAKNAIALSSPTMVMLDVHLDKGQSGFDLFDELEEKCHVVYLTSDYIPRDAIEEIKRGALDYLRKPLDLDFAKSFFRYHLRVLKQKVFLNYILCSN